MKTLVLALRNLLRNSRRSLTTLLAMIIGLVAVLLFGGYIRDINYAMQTGFVQRSGHFQLQRKDYFLYGSGNAAAWGIADYARVIDTLRADPVLAPMLRVVTPTLQLGGIAGNFDAGVSRTVVGGGAVVAEQNLMREWNDYHRAGVAERSALTGSASDAVVIGTGVARVLQLCDALHVPDCRVPKPRELEGRVAEPPADIAALSAEESKAADAARVSAAAAAGNTGATGAASATGITTAPRVEMLAATAGGAPNVASLQVIKAVDQGVKELDDRYVGMHLAQAQQLVYGSRTPQVTAVVLQLSHTAQMPAAHARLETLLAGALSGDDLEVQDFATLNPFYGQVQRMFDAVFGFVSVLIGAIVLFTVGNTMTMAVVERTVEIGTLRAIGLRRAGIRHLFLAEGLVLGVVGAALGVAMALLLAVLVNHAGLTWTPPGQVSPVQLTVSVWGETGMIVASALGLLAAALVSALWPAARAARQNIVDALRHV